MKNFFEKKLLPAITLTDAKSALPLAGAILKGGLDVMEITFRTNAVSTAIQAIRNKFPECAVGAGTILSPDQIPMAVEAGAQFGLSPGFNPEVVRAAQVYDFPFIPGVTTPSEIEQALRVGCKILKLFPSEPIGGVAYLKSLEGPYGHTGVKFIPMGGVDRDTFHAYLRCKSVLAAGGSWMAPGALIRNKEFQKITERVEETLDIAENL